MAYISKDDVEGNLKLALRARAYAEATIVRIDKDDSLDEEEKTRQISPMMSQLNGYDIAVKFWEAKRAD